LVIKWSKIIKIGQNWLKVDKKLFENRLKVIKTGQELVKIGITGVKSSQKVVKNG
jgi:hypothetical protein